MSAQPYTTSIQMTEAEYLDFERKSDTKHEYLDGMVVAMAGAKERHNLISGNLITELNVALREEPCRVYPGDMRVKIELTDSYTYPDVVVVCDEPQFEDDVFDTLLNPIALVEVLSASTEKNDRGTKFLAYRQLASFRDYLLVHQHIPHIEHFTRRDDGLWLLTDLIGINSTITLPSLNITLLLADLYRKVTFEQDES